MIIRIILITIILLFAITSWVLAYDKMLIEAVICNIYMWIFILFFKIDLIKEIRW